MCGRVTAARINRLIIGAPLRSIRARLALGAITAIAACALATQSARADGDPASDVLIAHTYFVPADARVSARQEAQLGALLAATARAGLDVRVAVIANVYDLGSALQAWLKPQAYAEFLGYELQNSFRSALIVVMPNGVGLNWPGHGGVQLTDFAHRRVSGALVGEAEAAVRALATRSGLRLGASAAQPAAGVHSGTPSVAPMIIGAWALALAAVAVVMLTTQRTTDAPRCAAANAAGLRSAGSLCWRVRRSCLRSPPGSR